MHICVTEVDAATKVPCTVEPQHTGPSMPAIKGLQVHWWDESTWPVAMDSGGIYLRAPKYYGTCDDDADTNVAGVLEVLTEADYTQRKRAEFYARQPYASWVFDEVNLQWNPPTPMPQDGNQYRWDEATTSWVQRPEQPA
jgi:hypothetical protein